MTPSLRTTSLFLALTTLAAVTSCGGESGQPAPPTAPSVTTVSSASMKLGTAGNVMAPLVPGETRQLWAMATAVDGTLTDVTNLATWQSSDPATATVSPNGVLRAAVEGTIKVSATYQKMTGSIDLGIEKEKPKPPVSCAATLDKPRLVYNAFGGNTSVRVTLTKSDCRWTLTAGAPWLRLNSTPFVSGDGSFSYEVLDNNTPSPRSSQIHVQVADGAAVIHEVAQEKPLGCSYVVQPASLTFPNRGGVGSFEVITTPADCQWQITDSWTPMKITSGASGIGRGTVTYTVSEWMASGWELYWDVRGLSGMNPPGRHTVKVQPR